MIELHRDGEVFDMRAPLHRGMTEILRPRLPQHAFHESIVPGRRYGGEDAHAAGIVDAAVAEAEVLSAAVALAASLAAKAHPVMGTLKRGIGPVLEALKLPLGALPTEG